MEKLEFEERGSKNSLDYFLIYTLNSQKADAINCIGLR
jgi:hypothetical protein